MHNPTCFTANGPEYSFLPLLGDDAAQFIFAEIAGLSIDLHVLCPGRYSESAKDRNQNNLPQEYLP